MSACRPKANIIIASKSNPSDIHHLHALFPSSRLLQGIAHRYPAPKPLPLARPPFKFSDLQKAVPRHCFKRNLATSAFHLANDLVMVATFGYLATFIDDGSLPAWAGWLLWPLYWFVQGTQMTGVWVLAHECGHQSFSESKTINNLVGLVCHSALLVPYHSWRITHAKHHGNTGSCANDEVFCPKSRTDNGKSPTAEEDMADMVHEAPLVQMFWIVFMLVLGWMPGYLLFNATGPSKYNGFAKSHFNPWAKVRVLVGLVGILSPSKPCVLKTVTSCSSGGNMKPTSNQEDLERVFKHYSGVYFVLLALCSTVVRRQVISRVHSCVLVLAKVVWMMVWSRAFEHEAQTPASQFVPEKQIGAKEPPKHF